MDREEIYKEDAELFKEETDYIEELVSKGIEGDELVTAVADKFIDEDEEVSWLVKDAKFYEKQGKFVEAIRSLDKVLEIRPNDKSIEKLINCFKRLSSIKVFFNNVEQNLTKIGNEFVLNISKPTLVMVKLAGDIIFKKLFDTKDFRGVVATASTHGGKPPKKPERGLLLDDEVIKFEIEKGLKEGKLFFHIK